MTARTSVRARARHTLCASVLVLAAACGLAASGASAATDDPANVVDDPTLCHPNGGASAPNWVAPITVRPGKSRDFLLGCESHDDDPIDLRIVSQPPNGKLEIIRRHAPSTSMFGRVQLFDMRYTPSSAVVGDDPFTLGVDGKSPATDNRFVMRALDPATAPGRMESCSFWDPVRDWDTPTYSLAGSCQASFDDPVTVSVVAPPAHGTIELPAPAAGDQAARYTPEDGFVGRDRVTLRYTTGTSPEGMEHEYVVDVTPFTSMAPPQGWVPPWTSLRPGFGGELPTPTPTPARGTAPQVQTPTVKPETQARATLGSKDVVVVSRLGAARVYADRKAWRRGLRVAQSTPALAVACVEDCQVTSTVRLDLRGPKARGSAVREVSTQRGIASGGKPLAVKLRLTKADRARARSARTARAVFDVRVREADGTIRSTSLRAQLRR